MQNNLHIVMNSFSHGSRILKETASLVQSGVAQHIYIIAVSEDGLPESEEIDSARSVKRIRLLSRPWPRNLIFQAIKYVEFCLRVVSYTRAKDIRFVNIHNLALLPLGVFLKWILKTKLVYDAHELETEIYGLNGLRQSLARQVERLLIYQADLVIVVSDSINDWYRDKYGLSNVVTVLNCPTYQRPRRTRRLHQSLNIPDDKKIVIYQGSLQGGRGIEQLLNVFAEGQNSGFVMVFMGYGDLDPLIREYAALHENIFLQTAVAPDVVLQYTASADIGISYIDNPSLNDRFCLPNKLFEYIMAGLPVVVNDAPEQRRLVNEYQIGFVLDNLTSDSLQNALNHILQIDSENLAVNLGRAARDLSWERQEKRMGQGYQQHLLATGD